MANNKKQYTIVYDGGYILNSYNFVNQNSSFTKGIFTLIGAEKELQKIRRELKLHAIKSGMNFPEDTNKLADDLRIGKMPKSLLSRQRVLHQNETIKNII